MNSSKALVPSMISGAENKTLLNILSVVFGVLMISILAQIVIPLPWTPVPITGQTLGATLVALLWGWKRGGTVLFTYIFLGSVGLPIFAAGAAGLSGATAGYLVGMLISSIVVGVIVDSGFTKTYFKTLLTAYVGSFIVLTSGVVGLSFFLPVNNLLIAGVIPFLPGDLIKNLIASGVAHSLNSKA